MIKPGKENIKIISEYDIASFQRWLRVGLETYLLENNVWGFEPMAVFIGQDEHVVSDLRNIYDVLPSSARANFRQAIANILASLEATEQNIIIFEHLLLLAGKVSAGTEIYPVVSSRVGKGFFGLVENDKGRSLFDITMMIVAELATPIENALQCLNTLISSPCFNKSSAYAGLALISLCRVAPNDLAKHLAKLHEKMMKMFEEYAINDAGQRLWAKKIVNTLSTCELAKGLSELGLYLPKLPFDYWFFNIFSRAEDGPLIVWKCDGDRISISKPGEPHIFFDVATNNHIDFFDFFLKDSDVVENTTPTTPQNEEIETGPARKYYNTDAQFQSIFSMPLNKNHSSHTCIYEGQL